MARDDFLLLLIDTILGVVVFYGLLTVADWGMTERIFFGAAFVAIMFAIDQRGILEDAQHEQLVQILIAGFPTNRKSSTEEFSTTLNRSLFERETRLKSVGAFILMSRYAFWFIIAWAIQRWGIV